MRARVKQNNMGFSLVELIIVILLIAIISGGAAMSASVIFNANTDRAAKTICSLMKVARQKAIAMGDEKDNDSTTAEVFLELFVDAEGNYKGRIVKRTTSLSGTSDMVLAEEDIGNSKITLWLAEQGKKIDTADEKKTAMLVAPAADVNPLVTPYSAQSVTYVFKKNTGGIASGSTGGGKYADIYVEGRETQHIIVVKETGRCYLR